MRVARRLEAGLLLVVVLATVGVFEAVRLGSPSLAILSAMIVFVTGALLVASRHRNLLTLRADLASWVDRTTAAIGEPAERLVDRAVSSYRADFEATPTPDTTTANPNNA